MITQNMNLEHLTSVGISRERLMGLQFKARKTRPKTSTASLLDYILEKAGIQEMSREEFEKAMDQLENEE
jgi:hypothetical protein